MLNQLSHRCAVLEKGGTRHRNGKHHDMLHCKIIQNATGHLLHLSPSESYICDLLPEMVTEKRKATSLKEQHNYADSDSGYIYTSRNYAILKAEPNAIPKTSAAIVFSPVFNIKW